MIHIAVTNSITGPEEGTALHWHGLRQKKTSWYDGVPSVQMCPIAPGQTFVYEFQADLYGSSWYHSHLTAQYAGGLLGPMVIHGPTDNYPSGIGDVIDLGPILLTDFYYQDYYQDYSELVAQSVSSNAVYSQLITSDNTLIQGKMSTDCGNAPSGSNCTGNSGLAKFNFTSGRTRLLRLINTSAAAFIIVSLDDHNMTVVANDCVPIKPYTVTQVQLFVGQRTDVLITADQPADAYWLRIRQPTLCALSIQPFGLSAAYYDGVDTTKKPETLPQADFIEPTLIHCGNDALTLTEPYLTLVLDPPDQLIYINITQAINATGHVHYLMNGSPFMADYNYPTLNETYNNDTSFPSQANAYNFGSAENVRLVFENEVPFGHPLHVHGQNMWVVDEGVGAWDGEIVVRPTNPQRRDTQTLQPNGYMVAQLKSDNPVVWPCE
jgi:FtsP/CotA-like multicopper oxidase with cupredoxin domain